jgi:hypothetical protein
MQEGFPYICSSPSTWTICWPASGTIFVQVGSLQRAKHQSSVEAVVSDGVRWNGAARHSHRR